MTKDGGEAEDDPCPECEGRGEVLDAPDRVLTGRTYYTTCPVCKGRGCIPRERSS
jgi:DnaJ-class molecular chaperone